MRRTLTWLLIGGLMAAGCRGDESTGYPEPPADMYTSVVFQVALDSEAASVEGATVVPGFFDAARVRPLLGRSFVAPDFTEGASRVAIVSHDFWTARLASSPEVIGRTIDLDGQPAVVVGIMPRGFQVPEGASVWVPRRP